MLGTIVKAAVAIDVAFTAIKLVRSLPDMRRGFLEAKRQRKLLKNPRLEHHK